MERKRTLTDYSDEELLEALEQKKGEQKAQEHETDVPLFLSFYKIKPGKDLVNKRLFYKLYKYWSVSPISQVLFGLQINQFLKPHSIGANTYFYVNQKAMDLSKQAYDLILKHTEDATKIPNWKSHWDKFIGYYNIKSGVYFIEAYILYNLYDKFVYETRKKRPLGYSSFINFCRLTFEKEKLTADGITYFGVHDSIKNHITDDEQQQLREDRKQQHGKKTKPKN
jgi:hypothetical protein